MPRARGRHSAGIAAVFNIKGNFKWLYAYYCNALVSMQSVSELCALFEAAVSARVPGTAARAKKTAERKTGPLCCTDMYEHARFRMYVCVLTCTHVCIRAQCLYFRAFWVYVCARKHTCVHVSAYTYMRKRV